MALTLNLDNTFLQGMHFSPLPITGQEHYLYKVEWVLTRIEFASISPPPFQDHLG